MFFFSVYYIFCARGGRPDAPLMPTIEWRRLVGGEDSNHRKNSFVVGQQPTAEFCYLYRMAVFDEVTAISKKLATPSRY